jgi:hypothetical protein
MLTPYTILIIDQRYIIKWIISDPDSNRYYDYETEENRK